MKKHNRIGTTESVILPDAGGITCLAKIDTGADSSSIWASNVSLKGDILSYTLFGVGSSLYDGVVYKTNKYKVTSVKSSFGHEEIRYKVKLRVKIGNRTMTSWFTLANRSSNKYPVLIGKSLLRNRYLVDVSDNFLRSSNNLSEVAIITAKPEKISEFANILEENNKCAVKYHTTSFDDFLFDINGSKTKIIDFNSGRDLSEYSLVYIKSHWNYPEQAAALADYLNSKSKSFFDSELRHHVSRGKLSELLLLSLHGINIPRSFAAYPKILSANLDKIIKVLDFPLVMKGASCDRGKNNYLVSNKKELIGLLNKADSKDIYLLQKYIPNDGFYRVNVFGKEAKMVVFRSAFPHDDPLKRHLNKPSGGVNAKLTPVGEADGYMLQLATKSAIYLGREIAGVDVIKNKNTKKYYVLEANSSPQLYSGSYVNEKASEFAKFIDKELKR